MVIANAQPGPLVWHHELEPSGLDARREGSDTVWVLTKTSKSVMDTLWIVDSLAVNSPLAVPLAAEDNQIPPVPPYLIVKQ